MSLLILPLDTVKPLGRLIEAVRETETENVLVSGMSEDIYKILVSRGVEEEEASKAKTIISKNLTDTLVDVVTDKLIHSIGHEGHTQTLRTIVDGSFLCGFPGRVSYIETLLGEVLFDSVRDFIHIYHYYSMISIWLERVAQSDLYGDKFKESLIIATQNLSSFREVNYRNVISATVINKTLALYINAGLEDEF